MSDVAVIGMGYVGLPLAVELSRFFSVVGFDINEFRVSELLQGYDRTSEVDSEILSSCKRLNFSASEKVLHGCSIYIICVPTPVDAGLAPDLRPLTSACEIVGNALAKNNLVVIESTVYPGVTEDICVPILEKASGLTVCSDFAIGYSPERVNPADKNRPLTQITKIISACCEEGLCTVDNLYSKIIAAGTYRCDSIKIAESAKVIENIQRDVNIALMNELDMFFRCIDVPTKKVLDAASTKWNFLRFEPGLVGGHCIGVDPYYLAHKAASVQFEPKLLLTSRAVNEGVVTYHMNRVLARISPSAKRVLIAGVTFKEDCPDMRNSKAMDLAIGLADSGCEVDLFDPSIADAERANCGVDRFAFVQESSLGSYNAIVIAVKHSYFAKLGISFFERHLEKGGELFDLKYFLKEE